MERILVPVDFSDCSRHAFRHALRLAVAFEAEVGVMHAYRVPAQAFDQAGRDEAWAQEERERLGREMEEFLLDLTPVRTELPAETPIIERILVEDYPEDATRSYCERKSCDLIVMGTQGVHRSGGTAFGSTTATLIDASKCPVLAVPDGSKDRNPDHLVYAVDFEDADTPSLRDVLFFADRLDAHVTLLHIRQQAAFDDEEQYKHYQNTFAQIIDNERCSFDLIRGEEVISSLASYLEENDADWLVMRNRHHGLMQDSLTRQMVLHTRIPLLAFPA